MRRLIIPILAGIAALSITGARAAAGPVPIPDLNIPPATPFIGHAATPQPISHTGRIPHSRFMAANGLSEIHNDGWQSDVYTYGGPLGRNPHTFSTYLGADIPPGAGRDCGSTTFDRQGRVISICIGTSGPKLYMFDPNTLATLATYSLPPRTAEDLQLNPGPKIFQDFSAGGYFYLNNSDQVVTGTTSGHIYVIGETPGPGFKLIRDYPLGLRSNEEITSQLPDSHGRLWFTARQDGVVGTLNFKTGRVHLIRLGHQASGEITKSLAADTHGGIYIPNDRWLYRFTARRNGTPRVTWKVRYPNDGVAKPGQLDAGTGTTPVLTHGGSYVGINDNANPMDVVIYRTATRLRRHQKRLVCRIPVFRRNQGADENAMIAAGRSYLIENNYGYQGPQSVQGGRTSQPGFARIEINRSGTKCRHVWTTYKVIVPSVVSKLSLKNGLIYTYTTNSSGQWYWTTLSYRTGQVVYRQYAGSGLGFNNNYAGIAIGRNHTEYLGTLGGMVALRDG